MWILLMSRINKGWLIAKKYEFLFANLTKGCDQLQKNQKKPPSNYDCNINLDSFIPSKSFNIIVTVNVFIIIGHSGM